MMTGNVCTALLKRHNLELFALSFIIGNRDMTEGLVSSCRRPIVYSRTRVGCIA